MKPLKRIIFLIVFIPTVFIGGVRWVCTGEDVLDLVNRLDKWTDK